MLGKASRPRHLVELSAYIVMTAAPVRAQWVEPTLSARSQHAMAYDSARGVTVLFGGITHWSAPPRGDTWEWIWETTLWARRDVPGPSPRRGHAMAFDSRRGVTILFGGILQDGSYSNQTWEWDGQSWTLRGALGPSPRAELGMAFDSARGVTVLYGGETAPLQASDQTWEWDGVAWNQRTATGPGAVRNHALAYDSARGVTVLAGMGYVWEWDGESWVQPSWALTSAMRLGLAYDSSRARVVRAGNYNAASATYEWINAAWVLVGGLPIPLYDNEMAFDSAQARTINFGGVTRQCISSPSGGVFPHVGSTHAWDGASWIVLRDAPWAYESPSLVYDSSRQKTLLVGGHLGSYGMGQRCYSSDGWEWDGANWTRLPGAALWLYSHAVTYDDARSCVVAFGGENSPLFGPLNQTWENFGGGWILRTSSGPSPRSGAAMAYDAARQHSVLFGGNSGGDQTWLWDGWKWVQAAVPGPSERTGHAVCYDPVRQVVVLFGGGWFSYNNNFGDTWEWNGQAWNLVSTTGPSPRSGHGMYFDALRSKVILYGGSGGTAFPLNGRAWEWDGDHWAPLPYEDPGNRTYFGLAYDSNRHVAVLFGGQSQSGDLWELGTACKPPHFQQHPFSQTIPTGNPVTFFAAAIGPVPLSYQWKKDGVDLIDGGSISGATTATLTIHSVTPADAGWYSVRAASSCGTLASRAGKLTIGCYPNCDNSTTPPILNIADFSCFLTRFAAQDPYANCDNSTTPPTLNIADFACFLTKFAAGCN